ncbi:MAG: universal stress protein [Pseudomonadota bacterium]
MKILLAADGSKYTKKALAFLATHESMCGPNDELVVLHVQPVVPPGVKSMVGASAVNDYYREESEKVVNPIKTYLARHKIEARCIWKAGPVVDEILKAVTAEKAHMVVMGTHGHGLLARAVMGSIAQRVIAQCEVPVLLVK